VSNVTGPVAAAGLRYRGAVPRNVVVLGFTSFFTDISSEALTAVLPLYFVLELRMTPLQFGLLDGLYQGASALVRVAGGLVADAGRRYKPVAFASRERTGNRGAETQPRPLKHFGVTDMSTGLHNGFTEGFPNSVTTIDHAATGDVATSRAWVTDGHRRRDSPARRIQSLGGFPATLRRNGEACAGYRRDCSSPCLHAPNHRSPRTCPPLAGETPWSWARWPLMGYMISQPTKAG